MSSQREYRLTSTHDMSQWFRNCSLLASEHAIVNFAQTRDLERFDIFSIKIIKFIKIHDFFYSMINFVEIKEF